LANYIPEDKILEIKNTTDIIDVISEFVLLKKAGKNYLGLCPFHSENAPSFTVSPEKQIFYCFGCTVGGNVFSFLMKYQNISFPEAAGMLARQHGIEIPMQGMSPGQKKRINERERLLDINRQAMDFFRQVLTGSKPGNQAMTYLKERGIKKDTIDHFFLGYAPEGWDNMVHFFSKKNVSLPLVEKAGLIVSRKNKDGFYDRFRGRIIFPILDLNMQVMGFGGRVMDDSMPKYLNSPETLVYNKGRSLYGIHKAKHHCRENDTVYVAEGYFDLLSLNQHGIQNAVATLGTALTTSHIQILKGYASRTILVYDSDDAGIEAAIRSVGIFLEAGVDARILVLPKGYDPDSYLFEYGYESFMDAADNAQSVMRFLMDSAMKKHGLSIEGKIRVISELKEPLASINDTLERSLYVKELAEGLGIDEAAVLEKVKEISAKNMGRAKHIKWSKHNKFPGPQNASDNIKKNVLSDKWIRLEQQIIAMMLQYPQILLEIDRRNILAFIEDDALRSIGHLILEHMGTSDKNVSEIIDLITDEKQKNMVTALAFGEDQWDDESCLGVIDRFESIRDKNEKALLDKIKVAEKNNDLKLLANLLNEKQKMSVLKEKKKMSLLRHST
jgi:DNA primase